MTKIYDCTYNLSSELTLSSTVVILQICALCLARKGSTLLCNKETPSSNAFISEFSTRFFTIVGVLTC